MLALTTLFSRCVNYIHYKYFHICEFDERYVVNARAKKLLQEFFVDSRVWIHRPFNVSKQTTL